MSTLEAAGVSGVGTDSGSSFCSKLEMVFTDTVLSKTLAPRTSGCWAILSEKDRFPEYFKLKNRKAEITIGTHTSLIAIFYQLKFLRS